jgi:hypothetical protein
MEIAIAVSGMLALLGGGAGLVAYYRANTPLGKVAAGAGGVAGTAAPATPFSTITNALGVGGAPVPISLAFGDTVTLPKSTSGAGVIASPVPTNIGRSSVVVVDTSTAVPPGYHPAPATDAPVDTGSSAPPPARIKQIINLAGTIVGKAPVNTSTNAPAVIA